MKRFMRINSVGLLLGLLSSYAAGQQFGGQLSISSGESDNARKLENNKLEERQDTYEFGLNGKYSNQFLSATAEYTGQDQRFAEDSQEERKYVDGSSSIILGGAADLFDIELKHSRRTLLTAPDDLNITNNQDDREIVSAIPRIKKRITDADFLALSADFSRVDYKKNELNNSDRVSADFSWLRSVSKTSSVNLMLQQTDIEYKHFKDADYRYSSAALSYSTQLRKFSYSLTAGYNQSERDLGDEYSSPTYSFSAQYLASYHSFQLSANRAITDSSIGGGNITSVNLDPTDDGAYNVDQIERTSAELSWGTQVICVKCTFGISAYINQDEYLVLPDERQQQGASVSFGYSFSDRTSFSYRISKMEQDFDGMLSGKDYTYKTQVAELSFDISSGLGLKVFFENEDRESDQNERTYVENFVGAAIFYSF